MNDAVLLPSDGSSLLLLANFTITSNAMIPETNLIIVKLAASIVLSTSARRRSTGLPANAIRAKRVKANVLDVSVFTLK